MTTIRRPASAERSQARAPWWIDAIRGALAGGVATWLMDLVTTGLFEAQSEAVTKREEAARPNGKTSVGNLVSKVETSAGFVLKARHRATIEQAIHLGLGVIPGAVYAVLRPRVPLVGAARGLLYGVGLFALNDEYLNMRLGFAGPIEAYPAETHWRGFVGHSVLGAATDTGIALLGG
jgi:hypothetical protein